MYKSLVALNFFYLAYSFVNFFVEKSCINTYGLISRKWDWNGELSCIRGKPGQKAAPLEGKKNLGRQ